MRSRMPLTLVLALVLGTLAGFVPGSAGSAPAPEPVSSARTKATSVVTHTLVSENGQRYRLRLRPVDIRSPRFGVFVQQPDGALTKRSVARTRAYVGHVQGLKSSIAVAVRRRGGPLAGQVTLDGRATAFFAGRRITDTRGEEREQFRWPSATGDDADRNRTVDPRQVPGATRRWDVGYDLDYSYVNGELGGSVAKAMDAVELTTVEMLATYEGNARLRPAIGRVVVRASQPASPYAGREAELDDVRTEWRPALDNDVVDTVAYLHSDGGGGGLAYVGTIGGRSAVSLNGSGNSVAIIRHELGHSWGPGDNHTNGPEGETIMSGNEYARFDGTELAEIYTTRNERLRSDPGRFPKVGTSRVPLPPYASLDLRDRLRSGGIARIRPVANDLDANGDRIRLRSLPARSHLGGTLTRRGSLVRYRAPDVGAARTLDWFRYRIVDSTGRIATGVVLVRVSPQR